MKDKLILVGGGGHCKSCIDVIEQEGRFGIAGIVDVPEKLHQKILGYEIIAADDDLPRLANEYKNFLITIGQIKSPERRISLYNILKELGAKLPVIISPLAYVSKHAEIGDGTIIMHHALINAGARVGRNCIINTKALVEHDAVIEDHCHIATGAVLNGRVLVSKGAFIGTGATLMQGIKVGRNTVVAAGAVVINNVPDGVEVKGVPAK